MKNILKYSVCLLVFTLFSCESWLDIKPVDRISGRALFETRQGFVKALNGIYTELTDRSIYGREMTAGMLDIMGQYYRIDGTNNYFNAVARYDYGNENVHNGRNFKGNLQNLWNKSYNLIVNLNIIIEECGESNSALNDFWFGIVKGEALALRAFLHLDMLRLFGPTHANDPDGLYIPYVTNSDQSVSPLRSSSEIKTLIVKDLTDAIALLKSSDPIIENGVMFSDGSDGDNTLRYRQYRMNYYAARALLARAYLWFGDKPNAYTAAKELLNDVGEQVFPFVSESVATQSENPDRVYRPEVMFGIYDNFRTSDLYDVHFSPLQELSSMYRMAYVGNEIWSGRISQLFITPNDIRYQAWISSYNPQTGGTLHYISKYQGHNSGTNKPSYMYMIPLIRISEVYLIAAECTTNIEEGRELLSRVRTARKAYDLESPDSDALMNNIEWEYRREFLGEGQMFYVYKRLGRQAIPDGNSTVSTQTIPMGTAQYVAPLPDSEADERLDNSNN